MALNALSVKGDAADAAAHRVAATKVVATHLIIAEEGEGPPPPRLRRVCAAQSGGQNTFRRIFVCGQRRPAPSGVTSLIGAGAVNLFGRRGRGVEAKSRKKRDAGKMEILAPTLLSARLPLLLCQFHTLPQAALLSQGTVQANGLASRRKGRSHAGRGTWGGGGTLFVEGCLHSTEARLAFTATNSAAYNASRRVVFVC